MYNELQKWRKIYIIKYSKIENKIRKWSEMEN